MFSRYRAALMTARSCDIWAAVPTVTFFLCCIVFKLTESTSCTHTFLSLEEKKIARSDYLLWYLHKICLPVAFISHIELVELSTPVQGTHSVCAEHSGGQCFQSWVDKRVNGLSVCLLPERSKTASIRCRWWAGWSWTALPGKQIHPSLICFTPPIWTFWKLLPRVQACKGNHLR